MTSGDNTGFDLLSEPWLPVLERDGRVRALGLTETLGRAHELRGLAAATPLEQVAILRLLVAITHRGLQGPRTLAEARAVYRAGMIPEQVTGYLRDGSGVWDLFDAGRPWLQAPSVARDTKKPDPLARLFPWQPSGNNPAFWEHTCDQAPEGHDPGVAARGLLVTHVFALGGGVSRPFNLRDGTVAGALVCLVEGGSLAETILLNSVLYAGDEPLPRGGADLPAWERGERIPEREGTLLDGYVDFLTLTTRRVLLERDPDGRVRRCRYAQGLSPRELEARDPFVPYRQTKQGLAPLRPNPSRSLWRDLPAIAAGLADPELRGSTGVLRWAIRLTGALPVRLRVVGIVRSQAKVETVVDGELRVPASLADSPDHRYALEEALARADQAERALRHALRTVAEHVGATEAADYARRLLRTTSFWASLEAPFAALVDELAGLDVDAVAAPDLEAKQAWASTLGQEARRAYERAVGQLGDAARPLVAAARGRDRLEAALYRNVLPRLEAAA